MAATNPTLHARGQHLAVIRRLKRVVIVMAAVNAAVWTVALAL